MERKHLGSLSDTHTDANFNFIRTVAFRGLMVVFKIGASKTRAVGSHGRAFAQTVATVSGVEGKPDGAAKATEVNGAFAKELPSFLRRSPFPGVRSRIQALPGSRMGRGGFVSS